MDNSIVWTDIPVSDLDRALRFYSAVLGVEVMKVESPGFAMGVLPHGDGGVGGCLVRADAGRPVGQGPLVYLNCAGRLDAAIAAVAPNGGKVVEPKASIAPHGWRAVVLDSEGNRIALHSD